METPAGGVSALVAGMFVSDVVDTHPLEEKISSGAAYARLGPFVENALSATLARTNT
jgi:hypothetical protein